MFNRRFWQEGGYPAWVEFFCNQILPEPHSTKQLEDAIEWFSEGDAEVMAIWEDGDDPWVPASAADAERLCGRVGCPVLVVHGTEDRCQAPSAARRRLGSWGRQL